ncbi:MAG: hypothetical protein AAF533_01235 [Acidobacteriota bacterium]
MSQPRPDKVVFECPYGSLRLELLVQCSLLLLVGVALVLVGAFGAESVRAVFVWLENLPGFSDGWAHVAPASSFRVAFSFMGLVVASPFLVELHAYFLGRSSSRRVRVTESAVVVPVSSYSTIEQVFPIARTSVTVVYRGVLLAHAGTSVKLEASRFDSDCLYGRFVASLPRERVQRQPYRTFGASSFTHRPIAGPSDDCATNPSRS